MAVTPSCLTVLVLQYSDTSGRMTVITMILMQKSSQKSFLGLQWTVTPLELTFDPPVRVALGVLDSPLGEADDGTLREVVHGLSAGHAPHVEGQGVLCRLLSLEGHLGYHVRPV